MVHLMSCLISSRLLLCLVFCIIFSYDVCLVVSRFLFVLTRRDEKRRGKKERTPRPAN